MAERERVLSERLYRVRGRERRRVQGGAEELRVVHLERGLPWWGLLSAWGRCVRDALEQRRRLLCKVSAAQGRVRHNSERRTGDLRLQELQRCSHNQRECANVSHRQVTGHPKIDAIRTLGALFSETMANLGANADTAFTAYIPRVFGDNDAEIRTRIARAMDAQSIGSVAETTIGERRTGTRYAIVRFEYWHDNPPAQRLRTQMMKATRESAPAPRVSDGGGGYWLMLEHRKSPAGAGRDLPMRQFDGALTAANRTIAALRKQLRQRDATIAFLRGGVQPPPFVPPSADLASAHSTIILQSKALRDLHRMYYEVSSELESLRQKAGADCVRFHGQHGGHR